MTEKATATVVAAAAEGVQRCPAAAQVSCCPVAIDVDSRQPGGVAELFDRAAMAMRRSPLRRGSAVRLPARGRLLATGDLHDNPLHLEKIVRVARLDQSPDHHLVLHEMIHSERLINGMDFSHRILIKIAQHVLRYPQQIHPLLANHELAQLTGKGVSKGAGNSVALFDDGLAFAFGDEWELVSDAIKRFIAAMALAALGGPDGAAVLCAHSLPAPHVMDRFDASVFERELTADDFIGPNGAAHLMVWGRSHTPEQIEALAARWGVKLFCLGHEHSETGCEVRGRRLVILNSDHARAAVLRIDLADIPDAERAMLAAIPLAAVQA